MVTAMFGSGDSVSGTAVVPGPEMAPTLEKVCPCGHAPLRHDRVASRYCLATAEGGLERGCICPPVEAAATKA